MERTARARTSSAGILALVWVLSGPFAARGSAQVTIGEPLNFDTGSANAEILDIARGDRFVYVSSPGGACGGEGDSSGLSVVLHLGESRMPLKEVVTVDLGLGEVTSVAVHPSGLYSLLTVKDPDKPNVNPGKIVAVGGNRLLGSIPVGVGPDSIDISSDGSFAVICCEAEVPVIADCDAETPEEDAAGSIEVIDLRRGPSQLAVAAVVTVEEMFTRELSAHPARAASAKAIEPEYAAISPDSSYALCSLQDQSAIAVVDLVTTADLSADENLTAEDVGAAALVDIVLLPHGFIDRRGTIRGVHPDGLSISAGGTYAVTANEAHTDARHLHGITVLDLRGGPAAIAVGATYCIFDLDPTLLNGTGLAACPVAVPGGPFPADASKLPRVDPEDTAVFESGGTTVLAVALERAAKDQDRGSALFLDAAGILDGAPPVKIDRKLVGINPGARPEVVANTSDGRYVFTANENESGTITRIEVGS